jgi:WD40 repeat protein
MWDAMTGKEITRITNNGQFDTLVVSPNGDYLLTGKCDEAIVFNCIQGTIRVWRVSTGEEVTHMLYEGRAGSVAFTPDGRYVIMGSCDEIDTQLDCVQGRASIWAVDTGEKVAQMIHDSWVSSVAFSPDGKYAASGGCDKGETLICSQSIVRVWIWQPKDLIANTCAVMPRNLTRAEWSQYVGDTLPYQAVCENLPIEPEPAPIP